MADEVKIDPRPEDLVDYTEAGRLVDRSKSAIRWWVRDGQLRDWAEDDTNPKSRRMVSQAELMAMVVQTGKSANPGGRGRGESPPPPATDQTLLLQNTNLQADLRVKTAELDGARAEVTAIRLALDAERNRAELERMRASEWKDRAEALSAEVAALRVMSGSPWWRRLLG